MTIQQKATWVGPTETQAHQHHDGRPEYAPEDRSGERAHRFVRLDRDHHRDGEAPTHHREDDASMPVGGRFVALRHKIALLQWPPSRQQLIRLAIAVAIVAETNGVKPPM